VPGPRASLTLGCLVLLKAIVAGPFPERPAFVRGLSRLVGGGDAPDPVPALMASVRRPRKCGFVGWNLLSKQGVGCLPHLADR
jgi:hypothetical protein